MCDKNDNNKNLERAVRDENLEEVKALLSAGADVNLRIRHDSCPNWIYETLLHCSRSAKIVKELLLRGADVNKSNNYNETPLHAAITLGKELEIVRELLKHGAAVDARDRKGNTALNHAVKRGTQIEIIELLKYGADINIKNREHRVSEDCNSPLDNAMRCPDHAKLLIKYALIRNFENDYKRIINLDLYKNSDTTRILSSYLNDCVAEIIKMKTDEIKIKNSLYDLVTNNSNIILPRSLPIQLLNVDYSVNYPLYNDIILAKIKQYILKKAAFLEKLKRVQICTLNSDEKGTNIMLVSDLIPYITEYLSNDDLLSLILASKKCNIQSSNFLNSVAESDTDLEEAFSSTDAKRAKLL